MKTQGRIKRQRSYIYLASSVKAAQKHVHRARAGSIRTLGKREFLRAYCSLVYLYPGFHPDCWDDWNGPRHFAALVKEAWRRAAAGQLSDNELYPYQAAKARILRAKREAGL